MPTDDQTNLNIERPSPPPQPTPSPFEKLAVEELHTPGNTSNKPEVSFGTHARDIDSKKRIVFGLIGILVLIGGLAIGVTYVQRQILYRGQAASGALCEHAPDCDLLDNAANSGSYTAPSIIRYVDITAQDYVRFNPGETNDGCYHVVINGNSLSWERVGDGPTCKDVSNVQVWLTGETQSPQPSPSPSPTASPGTSPTASPTGSPQGTASPSPTETPGGADVTAVCNGVKAYDEGWNLLTNFDLTNLNEGDTVRFASSGSTSEGTIDKARFTINGALRTEVTHKRPGTDEFYDEYTIPGNTANFTVDVELYHSSIGWF